MYTIKEVDGHEEEDTLTELHGLTFLDLAPAPKFDEGHWWLAYFNDKPVAFAGVVPSIYPDTGYFNRVGVLPTHYGNELQLRLMRAIERRARANGWKAIVSDTTHNTPSSNNFIRGGYRLFDPELPWAFAHSLYWRKPLY